MPGLSRVLPSDTYELYKHGTVVKLDTSLSEFSPRKMKWERSKITYIFSEFTGQPSIYRIDYAPKYYGLILQSAVINFIFILKYMIYNLRHALKYVLYIDVLCLGPELLIICW